jgi:uncharacterized membrane protein YfcA
MGDFLPYLWLLPLGVFAGAYGSIIGAGGGFVLVPVLLLLYPGDPPETITGISLTVVFFNALSGTLAYARSGRVDYHIGMVFSLATIPGGVIGALATTAVSRAWFDALFGFLLVLLAVFLSVMPARECVAQVIAQASVEPRAKFQADRGKLFLGLVLSGSFGFIASFLGIGGGILYVPALVYLLRFPVRIATATSLFVLAINSLVAILTHSAAGLFHHGIRRAIVLSIGASLGAQVGARLSERIHGRWIIRSLAIALGLIGLRFLLR